MPTCASDHCYCSAGFLVAALSRPAVTALGRRSVCTSLLPHHPCCHKGLRASHIILHAPSLIVGRSLPLTTIASLSPSHLQVLADQLVQHRQRNGWEYVITSHVPVALTLWYARTHRTLHPFPIVFFVHVRFCPGFLASWFQGGDVLFGVYFS